MRHLTAAQKGKDGGWHYVNLGRDGGHPIGYCGDHEPHATEAEARECYARWERDNIRLDGKTSNWCGCQAMVGKNTVSPGQRCDKPTKSFAEVATYMGRSANLCDEHLTLEIAIDVMDLNEPAGDAWVS